MDFGQNVVRILEWSGIHLAICSDRVRSRRRHSRLCSSQIVLVFTMFSLLFSVHPSQWCTQVEPSWAGGDRWGSSHPSSSGQEPPRTLPCLYVIHNQWVNNDLYFPSFVSSSSPCISCCFTFHYSFISLWLLGDSVLENFVIFILFSILLVQTNMKWNFVSWLSSSTTI